MSKLFNDRVRFGVRRLARSPSLTAFSRFSCRSDPLRERSSRAAIRWKRASLDRLLGDVEFLGRLQKSSVPFTCVDMPDANELTINIVAAAAQNEWKTISKRVTNITTHTKLA